MATASSDARSVELYVRSLSPAEGPVARHVKRVRDLDRRDELDRATVLVWGREVGLSNTAERTATGQFFLDRIAAFRSWADEHDVSVEPFFETREVSSSITGEEYATLTLPVCCLAEYDDDGLRHVAPYCNDRAVCTVADRIGSLDDGSADDRVDAPLQTERCRLVRR